MKLKALSAILLIVFLLHVFVPGCSSSNTHDRNTVVFNDSTLDSLIREAIKQPEGPIQRDSLTNLTRLDFNGWFIRDLTGLEYCHNLTYLDLSENKITDISALAGMIEMKELYLSSNDIRDISPLSSMTNLNTLSFMSNPISDLSPLADCVSITKLYLWDNQVSD